MISIEKIVEIVVKEVLLELSKRGIQIDNYEISNFSISNLSNRKIRLDFGKYKTPLLTETSILELSPKIKEIEVPQKTIITPSAFDLINDRKIILRKY